MKKDKKDKKGFHETDQSPLDFAVHQPNKLKKGNLSDIFEAALKAVERIGKKKLH